MVESLQSLCSLCGIGFSKKGEVGGEKRGGPEVVVSSVTWAWSIAKCFSLQSLDHVVIVLADMRGRWVLGRHQRRQEYLEEAVETSCMAGSASPAQPFMTQHLHE